MTETRGARAQRLLDELVEAARRCGLEVRREKLMREVGYGSGYRYAHAEPEGVGGIECLPDSLRGRRYYRPRGSGEEGDLAKRLEAVLQLRQEKWAKEAAEKEKQRATRKKVPPPSE